MIITWAPHLQLVVFMSYLLQNTSKCEVTYQTINFLWKMSGFPAQHVPLEVCCCLCKEKYFSIYLYTCTSVWISSAFLFEFLLCDKLDGKCSLNSWMIVKSNNKQIKVKHKVKCMLTLNGNEKTAIIKWRRLIETAEYKSCSMKVSEKITFLNHSDLLDVNLKLNYYTLILNKKVFPNFWPNKTWDWDRKSLCHLFYDWNLFFDIYVRQIFHKSAVVGRWQLAEKTAGVQKQDWAAW